ncbi:protein AHNAK2 isoform X4 [Ursus arctos]|uniref:protein AHNAK2 isoform X4 n=1 Tax=Ursus arctos TaxID=9644 RepID=UPI002547B9D6|nr:protein AHNAK2 isoform X4 [Ursus arctos]
MRRAAGGPHRPAAAMCDCFHMVLPTWPGAPGSVSGRQLQPEELDAETEEDPSVTEGPVDEIIRPRPQGSSPVYEYATEAASFGVPEDTPRRRASSGSGGRRSWWKRDSGDSRTFSRMSRPQEATEATLTTEVEAGASGYSVMGGGDQGIFVKQVLKDSTAAKLFSLREGDQLLSATIFFDNIKYEDALKILQYSEPYKVQFQVKRKRPATEDEEGPSSGARRGPKGSEKQDEDGADGSTETPTQTLEGSGDQEKLLTKPREGRGRRPQKERLSWPKFQSITSKRRPGPRRSHSSSEAYGRGDGPDVSPTSTDTEAPLPAQEQDQKAAPDGQRRTRFLGLRFRVGSGKGPTQEGQPSRGVQGGALQAGIVEEAGPREDTQEATEATVHSGTEDRMAAVEEGTPALRAEHLTEPGTPSPGALGEGASMASGRQKKAKETKDQEDTRSKWKPGVGSAPQGGEGDRQAAQDIEMGIARSALQGKGDAQGRQPQFQIQIPNLKTPKFKFSKEKKQDTEGGIAALAQGDRHGEAIAEETHTVEEGEQGPAEPRGPSVPLPAREDGGAEGAETAHGEGDKKDGDKDKGGRDERRTMLRFNIPSFGWSPKKDMKAVGGKHTQDVEQKKGGATTALDQQTEDRQTKREEEKRKLDTTGGYLPATEEQTRETQREQGDLSLGDKEVAARDSKFKMPKFKMPSFGVLAPSKDLGASVDVSLPKLAAEATLPSLGGEVPAPEGVVQLPTADVELPGGELEVSLPEGEVAVPGLKGKAEGVKIKGQLPKVQMPSLKMPKVDIKAPQVDIKGPQVDVKGPKLELKGAKGEVSAPDVEVSLPSVEVDAQVPGAKLEADLSLGDKEVAARDSKFKMPKFKMPSFGTLAPSKTLEASVDASLPKVQAEVSVPSIAAEAKTSDVTIELPSADLDVKTAAVGLKLPEGQVPEAELQEPSAGAGLKGYLPKVQMPSIKMPKVDFKAPQVDVKGPKLELKGAKGEVSTPDVEVSLPSVEVDVQVPGAKLEADLSLGDKEVAARDSNFKMPKFKMPSFGVSAPSKDLGASVDVSLPKLAAEATLPSLGGEVPAPEGAVQLPTADVELPGGELEVSLPEGEVAVPGLMGKAEGVKIKGQLPKVQMPSLKMPKVDIKAPQVDIRGPQVDIKGPKLELKGAKGEVSAPDVEVSLPSVEVDAQVPGAKLEADLSLGDKEVAARDSKFKMPKFKMPSFGVSAPSKDLGASVDVSLPKLAAEATLPSLGGEVPAPEGAVQLPTADVELPGGELEVSLPEGEVAVPGLKGKAEGVKIKGQLPKVQMPSLKMPKVDIKAPQVDIKGPQVDVKGPKLELKGAKGEVSAPDVEVSLPSVEVDAQVPGAKLEADLSLGDKEVAARDSKFKMPKFKMPSFGTSAPSKTLEASVDASLPKVQAELSVPSIAAEAKTSDVTIELPSADLDVKTAAVGLKLPEGQVPEAELQEPSAGAGLKGHLPKVQMPSIKMPKVDFKAPQVDVKGPKLELKGAKGEVSAPDVEVSLPSVEVDAQVPGAKLEADLSLGDKEVAARDSKFKMPKFKMPSFGTSAPSKTLEASVDASLPKVQAEVSVPSIAAEAKTSDVTIELPSADLDVKTAAVGLKVPEGQVPEAELQEPSAGAGLKGHLPKVQMPSIKMPKVDFKAPQVDVKGPKLELKGAKGEVSAPDVEVSLPSVEVDAQVPGAKLEADLSLGDKEVAARDSKFKMPKFKMPSFGVSAPSKDLGASVDVSLPKLAAEATLPSLGGEVPAPEGAVQLPTADVELPGGELEVSLPEGEVAVPGLKGKAEGVKIKGQLPKVQMPSLKMPKVDIKAPQVDIKGPQVDVKGPKLELKGAKGEVSAPDVEVSLPSVEVDAQVPGAKLEADLSLGDKEVAARDSKFKMPKFKMPSFGVSAPSKDLGASVDVSLPKLVAEATLPSLGGEVPAPEGAVQLPTADVELPGGELEVSLPEGEVAVPGLMGKAEGVKIKGQLPKVQMPSLKMPKVDIKAPQVDIRGPQVDIKGPKLELKGAKGEVSAPDVEVSLPSVEVDAQVPGAKLEADLSLGDKEVAARDSKFKMPKFKMPSFGTSAPSKTLEASVDASLPKVQAEVSVPSIAAEAKTSDVTIELPSADLDVKTAAVGLKVPEGQVPEAELQEPSAGAGLKGHLPKVQMPSIKMPKVDFKAPQVDVKGPKLELKGAKGEVSAPDVEVSLPSVEVDAQVPGAKLEADLSLGDKEVAARDSKFKMPKFKMPSFGVSAPSKDLGASVDVSLPKLAAEATMPSLGGEVPAPEGAVQLPTADVELPGGELEVSLPEGEVAVPGLMGKAEGVKIKGQLPKVQMPSLKMPKVDIKAPQVDIKGPQVDVKGPKLELKGAKGEVSAPDVEVSLPSVEVDAQVPGAKLEADLSLGDKEVAARDSKFKMPKFKMPSFGVSAPSKDLGASVDVSLPKLVAEATLSSLGGEVPAPEGAVQLPTADVELPGGELEVSLPEGEVAVPGLMGKAEGVKIKGQLPKVQMPSLKMPKVDIKAPQVDIRGPQVDIKGPKLELKGAKGEVSAPDVEVSLPSVEVDAQVPGAKLEADLSLGDKEVAARDSKFKMPKFKMPFFGTSAPSKTLEASVDASLPKVQAELSVPSIAAEAKTSDVTIELPSADLDVKTAAVGLKLPEGQVPEAELQEPSAGAGLKGHLPKVQMPSIKMPKVDFKAPQVDVKGPKLELKGAKGEVSAPDVEVSLPSVEVDAQVPGAKLEADLSLGDKEVAARDSKFKMPKFKMPSFGTSAPSKDLGASVDVSLPKLAAEATLPSLGGEVPAPEGAVQLPTADVELPGGELEVSLPEGEVAVPGLKGKAEGVKIKGQLPKVQMPSLKMPKVDIKAPQVDITGPQVDVKGPKLELKGAKGEVSAPDVEVSLPSVEVDAQVPGAKLEADLSLGDKEVAARDSKFKMPKFKMPSFGTSAPSKTLEASVDTSLPKVQAELSVPSIAAEAKTSDVTIELPSADLDVKMAAVGLKLPEGQVPEAELQEPSAGAGLKGHLPKVQMPSIKMPKVDFKAPQVDVKGPKLELKGAKGEVSAPDVEVSLPSVEVDAQVPGAKLEADLSLGDKEVAARDSKFKMPKFKMPSFGTSAPSKTLEASVDTSLPKVQAELSVPSIAAEAKTSDVTIELPSADLDVKTAAVGLKLPEGQVPEAELQEPSAGAGLKGHLPKVQMPSIKMPKVDFKAPQVDVKGPKLELKGAKGEVSAPDVEVSLPSVEVDAQVPGAKLEADLSLGDKEVAARDSKFKMPKFKMPSFGVSAPSKDLGASVDVSLPKLAAEATLPSLGGEVPAPEGAVQLPTADVELPGGELEVSLPEGEVAVPGLKGKAEGVKIKGQLPKVQMPSLKMPKVDIKAPQVDIKGPQVDVKGPKLELKGAKGEVSAPDVEVSLPSVEVDIQVPGAKLEADLSLGDKEVAARDSKFKMPKFKMPSFGTSAPSKTLEASVDASLPKVQAEVSVPSIAAEAKTSDVTIELPSADLDVKTAAVGLKLPEGQVPEAELQEPSAGAGLKGHLPKVQMPSIKMPKVDFKAPQVDVKGPKLELKGAKGEVSAPDVEVSLPSVEVDAQVPGAKLEADLSLGDKEVAARDSKFKMPKFKMPSFGTSAPSKDLGASVDVSLPKLAAEATLPSLGGEVPAPEGAVQLPTADVELPGGELEVSLPEGEVAVPGLKGKAEGVKIKGQLPKVQMPSLKMPKVDIKAPQVDITGPQVDVKGPKLELKGAKGEVSAPDVEVSLPSVEVDAQVPGAKLEADLSLGDKEVAARDSKFKMPKFKMPSFGTSAPSKTLEASVDTSLPKVQAELSVPSIAAEAKTSDVTIELPSADLDVKMAAVGLKLPEGQVPEAELQEPSAGAGLKGHLPKVQMPSIKMPKVDFKAPQVDVKGPKLELKGAKGEVSAPDVEVSLPSVEVDAQVPGAKLEAHLSLGDKEVAARDSKFKMPKFKMPSFGVSAPSKDLGASVDVSLPKLAAEATLPSLGGEVPAPEGAVQLPTADVELPGGELEVSLPEGEVAVPGLKGKAEGVKIKGQLPKVQMPSLKMPKVDIKAPQVDIRGPQVDIKGPKLELKGAKGEVSAPDVEVSLPSVEVDAQVPGAKLEADLSLGDKEVAARDSKFKMPKFKMPSFGTSAPSKTLEASVDASLPKVQAEVSMPSVEVDAQVQGTQLVGDSCEEVKEFSKGRIFKISTISVSSSGPSTSRPSELSSPLGGGDNDIDLTSPPGSRDQIVPGSEQHALRMEGDVALSTVKGGEKSKSKKSHFKLPKVFSPPGKSAKGFVSSAEETDISSPARSSTSPLESGLGGPRGPPVASVEPSMHVSRLGWLSGPHVESSSLSPCDGVTLTKYQVTVSRGPVPPELPCETPSGPRVDAQLPSTAGADDLPSSESILLSQPDGHTGPMDTVFPESYGRVTFPKFHRPKFQLSLPKSTAGVMEPGAAECALPTSPPLSVQGPDSSAEEAAVFPVLGGQLPPAGVSVSKVAEAQACTAGMSAGPPTEAPGEGVGRKGKGSPVKAPRLKLPSFRWSPKKGAESKADPGHSQVVDAGALGPPGGHVPPAEAGGDVSLEKEGEAGAVTSPALALLKVTPPGMTASTEGACLPRGDPGLALSGSTDMASGKGSVGGAGAAAGPPGADVNVDLPEAPIPSSGFVKPDLRPGDVAVEVSLSAGDLPLSKHGLSLGDGTQEHGLRDGSTSQLCGEVTAPSAEDPLQPSPTVGSPGRDAAAGAAPAGSRESWFRMPSLRLPSFRRPPKERAGSAAPGAQRPLPAAGVPGEGQAPTVVQSPEACAPASEGDAARSLQPPEAGADAAEGDAARSLQPPEAGADAAEGDAARSLQPPEAGADAAGSLASSYADVLRRNLDLHVPAVGLSASEVRVRPGAGSLPLQLHGTLAEPCTPPGEASEPPLPGPAGQGLVRGPEGAEEPPSQPEGPLRLRASSTDMPSQVSVVNVGQVWEDSVLRVQFPKLKVPRFSFPASGSEADVFVPSVRELSCLHSGPDTALLERSPGGRGTSIPKAAAALGLSSEAAPICKVRVHIQGAEAASRQVAVHSTVTAVYTELSGPEAFPTQIVRESEVPASETQTPSYGFSLLKGRVSEPPTRAQVHVVTADCGPGEHLREAPEPAVPGADPVSGDLQPDTGEPFEIICPSVDVPGLPACSPELRSHPGHGRADSCSDEEPPEILEFPPEEGQEAEEDRAPKAKPEGKRSSGLFRFWLPSIGFSSSVSETGADSQADPQRPAPVQTQPEARPPPSQEKGGWFRFPKLGFSSSPTKKTKSAEEEAGLAEQNLQDEAGAFYDARESFFPEETGAGEAAEAAGARQGSGTMVASAARTELILLEPDGAGSQQCAPGPATE